MRALCLTLFSLLGAPALACGPETDCIVGDRTYRLYVPEGVEPAGALVWAHGYRGSAAGAMRNGAFRRIADARGWAFVALKSAGDDWEIAHTPRNPQREEVLEYDYVLDVIADLNKRFPLAPDQTILTGFSAGGMFTWTMACGLTAPFAGFIPLSGTFWDPVPETCTAPPKPIVHIHGTEDGVVPLGGRPIGPTRQGDVPTALEMFSDYAGLGTESAVTEIGDMSCATRDGNGVFLEFCTFTGGHSFSAKRLQYGIDRVLGLR